MEMKLSLLLHSSTYDLLIKKVGHIYYLLKDRLTLVFICKGSMLQKPYCSSP